MDALCRQKRSRASKRMWLPPATLREQIEGIWARSLFHGPDLFSIRATVEAGPVRRFNSNAVSLDPLPQASFDTREGLDELIGSPILDLPLPLWLDICVFPASGNQLCFDSAQLAATAAGHRHVQAAWFARRRGTPRGCTPARHQICFWGTFAQDSKRRRERKRELS